MLDATHVAGIILRTDNSGAHGGETYDVLGPTGTSLGYQTVAAKAGDTVELFGVGFGPTSPMIPAGLAFSGSAPAISAPRIEIGGGTSPVAVIDPSFCGLSSAGLYQINLQIPAGLGRGDFPLRAIVGGAPTQLGVVISLQ
jgi:uncharacterized protein (TIGR03437 family)